MKEISSIQEAEEYIYRFDPYQIKAENQEALYKRLKACEELAIRENQKKLLCNSRIYLCNYYIHINDLENALYLGLDNRKLAETEKLDSELLSMYAVLFEIYLSLGDLANIEEVLFLYKEKLQDSQNYTKLCTIEILTAVQASNLKDYQRCLEANRRAIDYALQTKNKNLILYAYNNLGYQYLEQDIAVSREALEKALAIMEQDPKDIPLFTIAIVQLNASRLYFQVGETEKSYQLIRSCIQKLKKIKNVNELHSAHVVLSDIYIRQNRYRSARKLLQQTEAASLDSQNNFVRLACLQAFVHLFEKQKKYREALEHYRKFHQLNEMIFNEESGKKIRNLQILHEVNSIKRQRDHAEDMANLKHDFLANMSHEIRTPINSVLGLCYLLQQEALNDKQQQYVERLQDSGENLLGLINDILDISKIEAGKMEMVTEPIPLLEFLEKAAQPFILRAEQKKIRFQLDFLLSPDTCILGDPVRLTQIFNNLLSNALKFTEAGTISIRAEKISEDGSDTLFRFIVKDTGIGIAAEKLEQVFGRYEQADASIKNKFGGTGLGLSITQKLVDLMHGTIRAVSEPGKGTTFILEIPFSISHSNPSTLRKPIMDSGYLQGKSILLADDHEENRLVTRELLLNFNPDIRITEAENGREVIDSLSGETFDLIIMDLDMPELDGLDTTRLIRKKFPENKTGIIAHTASLLAMSKEELIEAGFDDLLLKPFKPEDLYRVIQTVLNKKAG